MSKFKIEKKFEEYRKNIHEEISYLNEVFSIYQRIVERKRDRLDELNIAPCFFGVVLRSFFSSIVLWTEKLLNEKSERGLWDFLLFVKDNIKIFSIEELQRRRDYPQTHWMLDREEIKCDMIKEDSSKLNALKVFDSIKRRRDKFYAHFDSKHFFQKKHYQYRLSYKMGRT